MAQREAEWHKNRLLRDRVGFRDKLKNIGDIELKSVLLDLKRAIISATTKNQINFD